MDHLGRIQRAIDYIEEHLKEELSTESIADVAHFSMWHFQRVFGAVVGDSVKEYIRKRRLASALIELTSTDRRILDIAIDHQFESQESFSRAFKALFRKTPGECRKEDHKEVLKSVLFMSKPRITIEYLDHLFGGLSMQPKFVTEPEKKIVGFGGKFVSPQTEDKSGYLVVRQLWQDYRMRSNEIQGRKGHGVGLVEAIPESEKSQSEEYWYLAGSEVEDFDFIPAGMVTRVTPAGRYAVFTHKGTPSKLGYTLRYIFGSWFPKSGEELRDAPMLNCRHENYDPDSEDSVTDIYVPVK